MSLFSPDIRKKGLHHHPSLYLLAFGSTPYNNINNNIAVWWLHQMSPINKEPLASFQSKAIFFLCPSVTSIVSLFFKHKIFRLDGRPECLFLSFNVHRLPSRTPKSSLRTYTPYILFVIAPLLNCAQFSFATLAPYSSPVQ
ncbi:hypothetical protein F5H01DRAFT_40267 [Linnemannia elongata]|nr:hypothetical protein F5H01DRAFT_40267 [Linnemannia elongata]